MKKRTSQRGKPVKTALPAWKSGVPKDPSPPAEGLLDMEEAIRRLKTTRPTFYRWLRAGKLQGMKVGLQWRFTAGEIDRFLKGEEPRIELTADIRPLLQALGDRMDRLGVKDTSPAGTNDLVRAVDRMIQLAVAMRASDIHIAPHFLEEGGTGHCATLRVRVDGVLLRVADIDPRLLPALIDRWKTMGNCDLREKNLPQDGRILVDLRDPPRRIDLRLAFLPTLLGESLTARILDPDQSAQHFSLDRLPFHPRAREILKRNLEAPFGLIAITGPSGCGKTTTLYACLQEISKPGVKTITIEDPVECFLPWAVQVQVRPQAGLTVPQAMRVALRSDPDVVMIGELRTPESVLAAQQIALTGHIVLTSLHVPDAIRAVQRLAEIGGEAHATAEAVRLVMAQRLVRVLCPDCSVEEAPSAEALSQAEELARQGGLDWGLLRKKFRKPVGCARCGMLGYRGREMIVEILEVTPEIALALHRNAGTDELLRIALGQGMTTLAADGFRLAAEGRTSLREVYRTLGLR